MRIDCGFRDCGRTFDGDFGRLFCSQEHADAEHRRITQELPKAPFSLPTVVMRSHLSDRQQRAREAMLADRQARPLVRHTMSVSEGMRVLGDQPLSPEDTARLNTERENDMMIRSAGLTPAGRPAAGELERRSDELHRRDRSRDFVYRPPR